VKSSLNQTFSYNGTVLEMKGLLVSEGGLSVSLQALNADDSFSSTGQKYAGKLFRIADLGHGASGTVHSALHEETFEIVAVKEVRFLSDRAVRHQTVRELRALASLKHPNIVEFKGAFLDPSTECVSIVLEYVLGGSLQDLVEMSSIPIVMTPTSHGMSHSTISSLSSNVINENALQRIAYDLTSALAYCHAKLTAHLDIKPSNILLTLNGTAKLADFGLARTFNEGADVHAATFIGTTKYMSPERLKGESYSFPADIWGLGLSLAAAAFGKFPIDLPNKGGDSAVFFSLLEKIRSSSGKMIDLPSQFSEDARAFVGACLSINPTERPRAEALLQEFKWLQNVHEQVQRVDSRAGHCIMAEVADAVAQRVVEIESKQQQSGAPTRVVTVEASLITNLALQLNLDEKDVKGELESAMSRNATSVLTDTMNSRGSRDSKNSRVSYLEAPSKKPADSLTDTMGSLSSKAKKGDSLTDTMNSITSKTKKPGESLNDTMSSMTSASGFRNLSATPTIQQANVTDFEPSIDNEEEHELRDESK